MTQQLIKCSDQELEFLKEILSTINEARDKQLNKFHVSLIGKITIRIFNNTLETEPGIYPGSKSFGKK